MNIEKRLWHTCLICSKKIKNIANTYGGCGVYYTTVFKRHLKKDHNISLEQYFQNFTERPKCLCGICSEEVNIGGIRSPNFYWKKYKCGRNPGLLKWSEKAKKERKGKGNPMYNKDPWNLGLTKLDHSSLMSSSIKQTNKEVSNNTRKKQSESAKKRSIHGHTGIKHSEESKEKMRQATLRNIERGIFKQTKTKPHIVMSKILDSLKIEYEEEKILGAWSFDFYIKKYNMFIEVDGDYFHSNPKLYPNGPISKTQKRNHYRDIKKNEFCKNNSIYLIRFWESDILTNQEEVVCKLQKLFV